MVSSLSFLICETPRLENADKNSPHKRMGYGRRFAENQDYRLLGMDGGPFGIIPR